MKEIVFGQDVRCGDSVYSRHDMGVILVAPNGRDKAGAGAGENLIFDGETIAIKAVVVVSSQAVVVVWEDGTHKSCVAGTFLW